MALRTAMGNVVLAISRTGDSCVVLASVVVKGKAMTYFSRRDLYYSHIITCHACVSSFTRQKKYFLDNEGHRLHSRYHTVSLLCVEAKKLLEMLL